MDARRGNKNGTRSWWVVVLVVLMSTRLSGVLAWYCSEDDRATLLEFRSGFVDVGGVFSSWDASSNCCTWRGVRCKESNGAVVELTLVGNSESSNQQSYRDSRYGEVGAGLVALKSLEQLTIQCLLLNEPVPSEWGDFSSNLKVIVINNANLCGDIPSSLAYIPNLRTLDLKSNHLTGDIPSEFCKQQSIRYIDVSFNDMNYLPVPWCLQSRNVIVIYNNQGQSTSPGPPGWSNPNPPGWSNPSPPGWSNPKPPGWSWPSPPNWSAGSDLLVPSIVFRAVFVALLVWTLL